MSDHSVNYSVTSPHPDSVEIVVDTHPSAIIFNDNAPMSPNTVLATLAAHNEVPTESLREIITGLVATIKLRELAWEADRTAMRARIDHAEDRLEAAMEAREDQDFDFDETGVPTDFIRNNNRVPNFQIPIGEGLSLPAEFIKRDEDSKTKVWGVTGRFGKGEPAGARPATPIFEKQRTTWATGGLLPTSHASDNVKINFANSTLPSTPSAPKPNSPRPSKRPVVSASVLQTLMDASLASSPSATARTVASPSEVTSPFALLLIEAVDEDVHSEQRVMSPAPGIGSGNARWTGVSSGNRPKV